MYTVVFFQEFFSICWWRERFEGGAFTRSPQCGAWRDRWSACPGSVREEAKYPDTSSPAAVDGTHTHTLLDKMIAGESFTIGNKITGYKISPF